MVSTNPKRLGMALGCGLALLAVAGAPACAADWVAGHYGPAGRWIPGHWVGGIGPVAGPGEGPPTGVVPAGRVWIPGFYGPQRVWHPGHWR